ncbi:M1 family metallopeptidase [Mucilaginibacter gynuensis]|uniref:Aminopeptidase N n=1 Tax=Mucilaginibacter gynuensis TaxID=1302236 RepID=A0ABP8HCN8_9SPHI
MNKYCFALLPLLFVAGVKAQVPGAAIDVQHYSFNLVLNDENNSIKGKAVIDVTALKNTPEVSFDLIAKKGTGKGMVISAVTENGKDVKFEQGPDAVKILSPIASQSKHSYIIVYEGIPADGLIISTNKYGKRTFFGDNWLKRARNWLPCVDDVADKATVEFTVTAPAHYSVVANGVKTQETTTGQTKLTQWKETAPISTKIMVIGVADFAVTQSGTVNDAIPVYSYVFQQDKEAGFKSYACANEILPVFIKKVGPYAYKKLANVQSKTIFGGMENAGAIFYYENSVLDKAIEALVAHEIGHQWFGDAVTEKSSKDVWLSEGFATFMCNYYHEYKYGVDSLNKRLMVDRKTIFNFEKTRQTPVVDTTQEKDPLTILNPNAYQKGGWVLHMLRRKIGEDAFWKGLRAYYAKYMNKNADTDDFRTEMEQASGTDLKPFFKQWLNTPGHPRVGVMWSYDVKRKKISLNIDQSNAHTYDLTVELKIDKTLHKFKLNTDFKDYVIPYPTKPKSIIADPNVNLLAEFGVQEMVSPAKK